MNGLHDNIRGSFPKMSSCCLAPVWAPLRCLFSELPEPPIRPESWPSRGQPLSLLCPSSCRWLVWFVPLAPDPSFFSLPPAGVLPMTFKSHPFLRRKKTPLSPLAVCLLFVILGTRLRPGDIYLRYTLSSAVTYLLEHAGWSSFGQLSIWMNITIARTSSVCRITFSINNTYMHTYSFNYALWEHPQHLLTRFVWDSLFMHTLVDHYSSADWTSFKVNKIILANCYFEGSWRQCPTHHICLTFWGRKNRRGVWKPPAGFILPIAVNCVACVELL